MSHDTSEATGVTNQNTFGRAPNDREVSASNVVPMQPEYDPAHQATATDHEGAADDQSSNKRRKKRKRAHQSQLVVFLNFCFSLIIFGLIGGAALIFLGNREFEKAGPLQESETYTVRQGASVGQIADALERRGVISSSLLFQIAARATGNASALKAGEFAFEPRASMEDVMQTIVSGRAIEYGVTIVEGMTVLKAFERIAANEAFAGPMPDELPAEGSLLADTKLFARGTERTEIVNRLSAAQTELVEGIWATRVEDLPLNDVNEFVTLASIVERETGVGEERAQVASVFVNRLRRGMRLQSDPTFLYGIFGGEGKPSDRPIYRSDIDTPTPYNTYTIDGLPPGPIAIPGRAALEAVANPAETDYLYFVADGTGGHAFARTLDEHNANVAKWRQIEREREQAASEAEQNADQGDAAQ